MKKIIALILLSISIVHAEELREWSSKSGTSKLTASVLKIQGNKVVLKSDSGNQVSIAIYKLCKEDQEYLAAFSLGPAEENSVPEPIDALFIGNSYTYYLNMPEIVKVMAKNKGHELNYIMHAPGGVGFEAHLSNPQCLKLIKSKRWDYIILQTKSIEPFLMPDQMMKFGSKLVRIAQDNCEIILLYQTMAYGKRHGLMGNSKLVDLMYERNVSAYDELAKKTGSKVVPVGTAWYICQKGNSKIRLHDKDQSHPSKDGAYLTALVMYGAIFGEKPINMPTQFETCIYRNGKKKSEKINVDSTTRKVLETVVGQIM